MQRISNNRISNKNPNQVISKEQIYEKIWGLENESESNNLEATYHL